MSKYKMGKVETKRWTGGSREKATNYLIQSQRCDLAARLTEEMNKYPKDSPERSLLKSIRFGVAYGQSDGIINLQTDYSPEDMMIRYKALFEPEVR